MLVLANGAFKSGSTWMRNILLEIRSFEPLPKRWQHPRKPHWLHPMRIGRFLREEDYASHDYFSKSHIFSPRLVRDLMARENVLVFHIQRDMRDAIVSHYHHLLRERRIRDDFDRYYRFIGRYKAYQIHQYNQLWSKDSPRLCRSTFEDLKRQFEVEVRRFGQMFGRDLTDEQIERIREETSLQRSAERRGEADKPENERFFRKGEIGEGEKYFSEAQTRDLQRILERGLTLPERVYYHLAFTARVNFNRRFRP